MSGWGGRSRDFAGGVGFVVFSLSLCFLISFVFSQLSKRAKKGDARLHLDGSGVAPSLLLFCYFIYCMRPI